MSSNRSDELVSTLNSLGFYSEDGVRYSNGTVAVERVGSTLIGTTIEELAVRVTGL